LPARQTAIQVIFAGSGDAAGKMQPVASDGAEPEALRTLREIRPLYFLPADPLAEEVLIPGFRTAAKVDCMVGFFSSSVLASLAPGLATYIGRAQHSFRLIISPLVRAEDCRATNRMRGARQSG
jgi:hypothetical protein